MGKESSGVSPRPRASWVHGDGGEVRPRVNAGIVEALKRAHRELVKLNSSPLGDLAVLHQALAPATQYERQLCRLALLSPVLQRRILSGRQPAGLSLRAMLHTEMPLAWADQLAWIEEAAQLSEADRPTPQASSQRGRFRTLIRPI
jgi:hypothetical protein